MSCSSGLPDVPDFGCGGNIKRIQILDSDGNVVIDKKYRKWEHETVERLKDIEEYFIDIEHYEAAAEVRDEITLKKLGL